MVYDMRPASRQNAEEHHHMVEDEQLSAVPAATREQGSDCGTITLKDGNIT